MFNALTGMGGGGQVDVSTADEANTALYSTFAIVGFFAGSFTNKIGIKNALSFGGLGYCIYVASFLCYSHTQNKGFNIFAGALLGVCAGLLWTAQGAIMMSYPKESSKGKYISYFWIIFNLGAVIGSLVSFATIARGLSRSVIALTASYRFQLARTLGSSLKRRSTTGHISASWFSPLPALSLPGLWSTPRMLCAPTDLA